MKTRLLIEGGILLKPYILPWRPQGYRQPRGWTPDEYNEWVQQRRAGLLEDYRTKYKAMGNELTPALLATAEMLFLQQAVREHGEHLQQQRKPWPGWMPVVYQHDRDIGNAYRRMFIRLNPDYFSLPAEMRVKTVWPPDGPYEFDGREMEPADGTGQTGSTDQPGE